jgi:hypothetical protein
MSNLNKKQADPRLAGLTLFGPASRRGNYNLQNVAWGFLMEQTMIVKRVSTGQMWRNKESGEIYVVTSLYKDVLASYALLRMANHPSNEGNKRARIMKTESGEGISGFILADLL